MMSADAAWASFWADHNRWLDARRADAELAAVQSQANADYRELYRQYAVATALADGLKAQLQVVLDLLEDARPGSIKKIAPGLGEYGEKVAAETLKQFDA